MKRKRYFCDWLKDVMEERTILLYVCIIIISIILIPISCVSCYKVCTTRYGSDIKSYFEEKYPSLKEIDSKIILEEDEMELVKTEYKKNNETDKEEYSVYIKCFIYLLSALIGLFLYFIILLIICIVVCIAECKSRIHKSIDSKRKFHNGRK